MEYSVEALAEISRVSVRTLHYYDEIGLLKPMIRMRNGRRLYGTEQLLQLQEILYFKEVGFSLNKIKTILHAKNLNKSSVLSVQKNILIEEITRLEKIVKAIDKTIEHYKECKMTTKEICEQFEAIHCKVKEYEKLCEKHVGKEAMDDAREQMKNMSQEDMNNYTERCKNATNQLVAAINNHLLEDSEEVQALMHENFKLSTLFKPMSKETYLFSRSCFLKDSELYSFYEKLHPKFPEFLYKAMGIFASHHFCE